MPKNNKNYFNYFLMLIGCILVFGLFIFISNTADSEAYKNILKEKNITEGEDLVSLLSLSLERYENGSVNIKITESTFSYLKIACLLNFIWVAAVSLELQKKYIQNEMYGSAEWGNAKQFKKLKAKKIIITNRVLILIKTFFKTIKIRRGS